MLGITGTGIHEQTLISIDLLPQGSFFLLALWRGRDRDRDQDQGGAFRYSRRGLRLRRRGAYGIHRASGPWCQGLCRKVASLRSGGNCRGGRL